MGLNTVTNLHISEIEVDLVVSITDVTDISISKYRNYSILEINEIIDHNTADF